jgi:hypothetical protein
VLHTIAPGVAFAQVVVGEVGWRTRQPGVDYRLQQRLPGNRLQLDENRGVPVEMGNSSFSVTSGSPDARSPTSSMVAILGTILSFTQN